MAKTQTAAALNALNLEFLCQLPFHGHLNRKIKITFSYSVLLVEHASAYLLEALEALTAQKIKIMTYQFHRISEFVFTYTSCANTD